MLGEDDQLVEKARALAARVHAGQTDKGGHPYLDHPLRVAESVRGEGRDAMVAAILHDVIEDGGISAAELRAEGFPEAAVQAVEIVTKRNGEHGDEEGYRRFIERVATSGSRLAMIVKLADLADNSDLSRLGREPTAKDLARARKYEQSRRRLLAALHG
jgi:(p)ppGpp synthase/HD superfamily hydrolase